MWAPCKEFKFRLDFYKLCTVHDKVQVEIGQYLVRIKVCLVFVEGIDLKAQNWCPSIILEFDKLLVCL